MDQEPTENQQATKASRLKRFLKDHFIPHEHNDHKPLAIRSKALKFYAVVLIVTKIIVTGFLFASYPSVGYFSNVAVGSIIELTNQARQQNNLPQLNTSQALNMAAYQKAQDMVNNNYFSHESPTGANFWNFIAGAGYQYLTAGENLAMDFTSAQSVHTALMSSSSHYQNIINPNFTDIGASVVSGTINGKETMVLVQMFGAAKPVEPTPPPAEVEPAPEPEPEPEPAPEPPAEETEEVATTTAPEEEAADDDVPVPTPEPVPVESAPAPAPYFKAELVEKKTDTLSIEADQKTTYWIDLKNTGNTTWYNSGDNFIALNATDPAGRESSFQHGSWLSPYRPAKLVKEQVAPGELARFEFDLKAPSATGEHQESFQLVAENLDWIEGSHFTVNATVTAPVAKSQPAPTPVAVVNENKNTNQITNKESEELNVVTLTEDQLITGEVIKDFSTVSQGNIQQVAASRGLEQYLVDYSQIIFWAILVFVGSVLLVNIFVNIRVQYLSVIIPAILVIGLAAAMLVTSFHFMENAAVQTIIL